MRVDVRGILNDLGLSDDNSGTSAGGFFDPKGGKVDVHTPITGERIASVRLAGEADYERVVGTAVEAFGKWREVPAPKRGEVVRLIGEELRKKKAVLGRLVTLEMGKIIAEGEGEIQEMIDIADFAVGLSRQVYGLSIASERPRHRILEQWQPLGAIGIITSFNFPTAVWAWNAFIAAVCGDTMIWKPSHKTPLCAIAIQKIVDDVLQRTGYPGVMSLLTGPSNPVGEKLVRDPRVPLISATGSVRVGRHIGAAVAERFGRSILELGGNNSLTVMQDANLDLALRAVVFGAVGTAGQRCTSTRRLLVEKPIARAFTDRLVSAYEQVRIGNPLEAGTLMGPLVDTAAVATMQKALAQVKEQGGEILYGGKVLSGGDFPGGCWVEPCIVKAHAAMPIVKEETFAPVLYVIPFEGVEQAIRINNAVPQGLSSAIFTDSLRAMERFLGPAGSDCGIANVNIGTSGAEIGGAFGGEKETGGGREAGSDCWKAYMRRQTQTVNGSDELPLAQGITFG